VKSLSWINKFVLIRNSIFVAALALFVLSQPVFAQSSGEAAATVGRVNAYTNETESEYPDGYKPVTNMDVYGMSGQSAATLMFQADYLFTHGNTEGALLLIKKSLAENDDDSDTHCLYAKILEKKLRGQEHRDPKLFNKCVKEWLIVMREEKGIEKGLYWHGFATPYGRSFGDEDKSILAAQRLYKLTGMVPRNGQSDKKYLSRVLKPTTTEVTGKLLNAPEAKPLKLADEKSEEDEDSDSGKKTKKAKKAQRPPVTDLD